MLRRWGEVGMSRLAGSDERWRGTCLWSSPGGARLSRCLKAAQRQTTGSVV